MRETTETIIVNKNDIKRILLKEIRKTKMNKSELARRCDVSRQVLEHFIKNEVLSDRLMFKLLNEFDYKITLTKEL